MAGKKLKSIIIKFNEWVVNNKLELNWGELKILTFGAADNLTTNKLTKIEINNV